MERKVKDCLARAALDNFVLPKTVEGIIFSDFVIKKSPNCIRERVTTDEDGSEVVIPCHPTEDEYQPGFPSCQYFMEIDGVDRLAFDEARKKVIWAIDRLRLFKSGLLWGDLYGIYDPKEHPVGAYELKRAHSEGPYPANLSTGGYNGVFTITEPEVDSIISFVNDLKDAPNDFLSVALRRFHLYFDRDLAQDRAIDLMVALESMFSEDSEAVGHKIALRIACLMEPKPEERKTLFRFIKAAYKERSSIVHGNKESVWLEQASYIPAQTNLNRLEEIVRSSLLTLLKLAQRGNVLKPSNLDGYLFFDEKPSITS